jgi:hypothetical protein
MNFIFRLSIVEKKENFMPNVFLELNSHSYFNMIVAKFESGLFRTHNFAFSYFQFGKPMLKIK